MRVAPGAQAASAPGPKAAPQGQPSPQVSPAQAIQMIEHGFLALGKALQAGGSQLPPDDIKLFRQAAQATDAMIESLTGGSQDQAQQAQKPSPAGGPMPENAAVNSSQGIPQG